MTENESKPPLWMRFVDFEKIRQILHIVERNNGKLNVAGLERVVREKKLFRDKNGTPKVGHSTLYHYRKIMENLSLISLEYNKNYWISDDNLTSDFLRLTNNSSPMDEDAKECLRKKILENDDCKRNFFDLFISKSSYDLSEFRSEGVPVRVKIVDYERIIAKRSGSKKSHPIKLFSYSGSSRLLDSYDAIQAIFWGVRLWSVRLDITNEIYDFNNNERVIYPIATNVDYKTLFTLLVKTGRKRQDSNWLEIYLPEFIYSACTVLRPSLKSIHLFITSLIENDVAMVSYVPVTMSVITANSPYGGMDETFLRLYPYISGVGHISHLRLQEEKVSDDKIG